MDGYCTRVMREGGRGKRRTRKGKRGRKNGGRSLEEKTSMNMEKVSGHFTCSIFEKWCEINDAKAVRSSLRMEGGGREEKSSSRGERVSRTTVAVQKEHTVRQAATSIGGIVAQTTDPAYDLIRK